MQRRNLLTWLATSGLAACASAPPPVAPPMAPAPVRMPRLGIALGGGGTRGFAHVGVLKALESHQLAPSLIAGTSAGSVVGALYASGMTGFKLQETSFALDEARLKDLDLFGMSRGLVKGQKLQDYINELVNQRTLDQLGKPFVAVATDLDSGQRVVFARGNTGQAVRASCSIPGLFQPVEIAGKRYVDGGVVSPVPVDAARQLGADVVIAVDISNKARGRAPGDMLGTLSQSIAIMGQKLGQAELARADVIVRPKVLDLGSADFSQRATAIVEGEKAALAAMPQIRERVARLQAERTTALHLAQQKAAEAQRQACLDKRSRLQKVVGMAGLDDGCAPP